MADKKQDSDVGEVTQTPQEAGGIERSGIERKPDRSKVKDSEVVHNVATGRVVTTAVPSDSDADSWPHGQGAKYDDPPVRTSRPDVPIAESLGAGAGEHVPPDPEIYREDGRIRDIVEG